MSIFSSALHSIRVRAGLPAITLGNVAKAVAPAIPIPGLGLAVNALTHKSQASEPTFTDTLKMSIQQRADALGDKLGAARKANETYNRVTAVSSAPVPLWLVGGAALLFLLSRK